MALEAGGQHRGHCSSLGAVYGHGEALLLRKHSDRLRQAGARALMTPWVCRTSGEGHGGAGLRLGDEGLAAHFWHFFIGRVPQRDLPLQPLEALSSRRE